MTEARCPICDMEVRSDASVRESCALCGMGIPEPALAPSIETLEGQTLRFCCIDCAYIYRRDITSRAAVPLPAAEASVTCPYCGEGQHVAVPAAISPLVVTCQSCGRAIVPRKGECCVLCSHADVGCRMRQVRRLGAAWFPALPLRARRRGMRGVSHRTGRHYRASPPRARTNRPAGSNTGRRAVTREGQRQGRGSVKERNRR